MARKIIILDSNPVLPNETSVRYAMWADVPMARIGWYANADATSQVADATDAELDRIRAGEVSEMVEESRWPAGTSDQEIRSRIVERFAAFQSEINARNPWASYGTSWDGSSWIDVVNG